MGMMDKFGFEGKPSNNIAMGPSIDKLETSSIITADEYGSLMADRKRKVEAWAKESRERKLREFERLKAELDK